MKKLLTGILAAVMTFSVLPSLSSCDFLPFFPSEDPVYLSPLKVNGKDIVNDKGEVVYLRGTNVGGWGPIEQWMNGFVHSYSEESSVPECIDHLTTSKVFIERFGIDQAENLWKEYQKNWFNEQDFKNCADMGMNVLRLPFTYMNVDFDAVQGLNYAGKSYDFSALDEFINMAAKYGMYTILDMHGGYGSQNGKDHSGEVIPGGSVDFYENTQKKELTKKLWKALAEHYKDSPNVAGYDILNEPADTTESGSQTTSKKHWDYFDEVYDEIRSVDSKHIVIFESCWDGANLPQPSEYGWKNCAYSFHHYTSTSTVSTHTTSWNGKIDNINSQNFGVPIYMGEFTCYNPSESWDYTLDLMNANGWHWTSWTYKVNSTKTMAWGIYNIVVENSEKVNAHEDSYETILAKFKKLNTSNAIQHPLEGGGTVYEKFVEYCASPVTPYALTEKNYSFKTNDYKGICQTTYNDSSAFTVTDGQGESFYLVKNQFYNDGSVQLKLQDKYLMANTTSGSVLKLTSNQTANSTRFYLLNSPEGYRLLCRETRKYVRYDEDKKIFCADAVKADAEIFHIN